MAVPSEYGTWTSSYKTYTEELIMRNYNIFWNSIVRFQYNAIATGDAFNIQVYINATIEGDVLRYDDHVIRGMLLWKLYIMCNWAISLASISDSVTLGIVRKSR
jgi:thiamine transporter ThiT